MTEGDRQIRLGPIETVNRLHAVVDRLESENADLRRQVDELRLSSSRVPQDSTEMRRLLEENRGLVEENRRIKQRLEKTAPRVAWAEQLTSEEGKESKLTVDYRRLSRELRKSQLERQETLEKLADVEASHEKLREDYQRLVQISSQRRRSHPDSISGVVVLEDKLTAKEAQLQAKQERIRQLEEQLRVEVEKSHTTQYEIRRLKSAFNAQNWTPSRDLNGDELTRQIRQLKTEISRLEGENGEFKLELEALNRYIRPAVSASQLNVAQVMQRMKNYDIILTENIELKLERNGNGNGRTQRSS
uniref:Uncharacterized protein n=2 Tax=Plectus sambesii TaxID=2011161 RepID=A0A914XVU7_9BILA